MKQFAAAALVLTALAAQATPPAPSPADLRRLLTQVRQGKSVPAPRELTARERAELRRQLSEARQARRP